MAIRHKKGSLGRNKMTKVKLAITVFFEGYKHDYLVEQEVDDSKVGEAIEGITSEMKPMCDALYEGSVVENHLKLSFSNSTNTNNIYITKCNGIEYKVTTE